MAYAVWQGIVGLRRIGMRNLHWLVAELTLPKTMLPVVTRTRVVEPFPRPGVGSPCGHDLGWFRAPCLLYSQF